VSLTSRVRRKVGKASVWFARRQSGEPVSHPDSGLTRWLARDPRNTAEFRRRERAWELAGQLEEDPEIQALLADADRGSAAPPSRPGNRAAWGGAVAAVLAIAVATWHLTTREVGDHVYDTGIGEFRLVVLPDQSRMMLNTGTRARVAYRGSVRVISLEHGEATFNVVHDISRPFEVHTGNVIARALGTEFDVQSSSGAVTVSVLSGTVQVIRSFGEEIGSADLHSDVVRGGEAVMYRAHEPSDIRPADVGRIKAWRARRVQFDNVTLEKALVEYNRYLRTPIKIGDPAIADLHISGVFRVDDPEGLLRTLQEAFGMRIDRQGNAITLLPQVPSSPGG